MLIFQPRLACTIKSTETIKTKMKLSVKIKVNQIQKTTTKCHELRSREAEYTSKVQNAYLT